MNDTFPKLLLHNAATRPTRLASRLKEFGIWQSWTWAQVLEEVRTLAAGLAALGLGRGDTVAIIGHNRPRLYWTVTAVQSLGAVPVPVYQDAIAEEMAYVLAHADIRIAVVQDQEQVDKLLSIADQLPGLGHIVYEEERGLRDYDHARLSAFATVQEQGRAALDGAAWEAGCRAASGSDLAVVLYTSGTTGKPKGVMLSHDNLIRTVAHAVAFDRLSETEEVIAYLPMAWAGDHVFSYAQSYIAGYCVSCPEGPDTAVTDRTEIGPTYFFAPPRVFENLLTSIMVRMEDASGPKRRLFQAFIAHARRWGGPILDGVPVPVLARLVYGLGQVLVYGPLKSGMGLDRLRVGYTAGEAIGPDMFGFYRSLGINLKQLYGQTEASVYLTLQPDKEVSAHTVGRPAADVELRLDPVGELQFRSPGAFLGYLKDPGSTAGARTEDGWVRTGDAGFMDDAGHLRIVDRAKDVGRLRDGTLFAPKYLENKLKFFPHIKEAVAIGDGMAIASVMLNIDLLAVGDWAERRGITYASYQELAGHPDVHALLQGHVEAVNRDLVAEGGAMRGMAIRRFLVLPKELDADDGELTRTQKVRRRFVAERYATLIAALNEGAATGDIVIETVFEDGSRGSMRATVAVHDLVPALAGGGVTEVLLDVADVSLAFGGVQAIAGVSFDIRKGEIRAIIGPNGAGKTSMLNVINGFYHPQRGRITYKGQTRARMRPHVAAADGIARTFQNVALFKGMSTLDNIMAGRGLRMHRSLFWQALRFGPALREEIEHREAVERIIDFLEIEHIRKVPVGKLPYGLQKRVELGRALAMEPELLLLDEPMAGMNLEEKQDMCRYILDVSAQFGTTIALIEHDMGVVMDLSDRVVVLDYGRKIADGTPDEVRANPAVIAAYLGLAA